MRLGLTPGETVPVRDLILGIVTKSANDAATVLAEGLGGSEPAFAQMMNAKAQQLGMDHSSYHNASGLPDPEQRTTARDIARLALALIQRFPREYRYFSVKEFDFHGEAVVGHDHLLDWYPGADGIKTGFINASGYNLATSAVQNGHRLVGVILGGRTARRDQEMAAMLDKAFAEVAGTPAAPSDYRRRRRRTATAIPDPARAAVVPGFRRCPSGGCGLAGSCGRGASRAGARAGCRAGRGGARRGAGESACDRRRRYRQTRSPVSWGRSTHAALHHLAPVEQCRSFDPDASRARRAAATGRSRSAPSTSRAAEHAAREAASAGGGERASRSRSSRPTKAERPALYRARLLRFTQKGAQAACAELHRHGIACSVVHAGSSVRVANG